MTTVEALDYDSMTEDEIRALNQELYEYHMMAWRRRVRMGDQRARLFYAVGKCLEAQIKRFEQDAEIWADWVVDEHRRGNVALAEVERLKAGAIKTGEGNG